MQNVTKEGNRYYVDFDSDRPGEPVFIAKVQTEDGPKAALAVQNYGNAEIMLVEPIALLEPSRKITIPLGERQKAYRRVVSDDVDPDLFLRDEKLYLPSGKAIAILLAPISFDDTGLRRATFNTTMGMTGAAPRRGVSFVPGPGGRPSVEPAGMSIA